MWLSMKSMKSQLINVVAWCGAVLVSTAPFIIDTGLGKLLIIIGLCCLMVQAIDLKQKNLIALNFIGVLGYASNI